MAGFTDGEFVRENAFELISPSQSVEYDESTNSDSSSVEESTSGKGNFHQSSYPAPDMLSLSHGIYHAAVTAVPFLPSPSLAFCHERQ